MNGEKAIIAYFKVLSWQMPRETEKILRIASNSTEIKSGELLNISLDNYHDISLFD
jgi:hypothetical protein